MTLINNMINGSVIVTAPHKQWLGQSRAMMFSLG
jgi:hypothetical protein